MKPIRLIQPVARACDGSTKSAPDPRQGKLSEQCAARGLPLPFLDYAGMDACWPDFDLALLVHRGGLKRLLRRVNRLAAGSWFVVVVTPEQWEDGTALDLVAKVVKAVS
jgi:hypothetical protein